MKKIKIFLGAYVNYPNAQNINCDNIAKTLDKEIFDVHTMYLINLPINKREYQKQGIVLHPQVSVRYINYFLKIIFMLLGKFDILYLPKRERTDWICSKILKKKKAVCISSVESVIRDQNDPKKNYYIDYMDGIFAISECIKKSIKKYWNVEIPVLPLGTMKISDINFSHCKVKNIIWVGNIKANKRPKYFINCARQFPQLSFTMVGDGVLLDDLKDFCKRQNISNITFTGRITNSEVYAFMRKSDLLLMTSEYEGLPKVIQEAAQCGVPSIYINENYSVDFIEDGINGYAVPNLDIMIEKVRMLMDNPQKYQKMSANASQIIKEYTWENLIEKYEKYFIEQYKKKRGM